MQPNTQLESMDLSNINSAAIFSTFAGFIVNHSELPADVSLAYADAYNRWLKDYCDFDSDRLKAVGLISRHDPKNMVEQLEKIVENGWTSIPLRPEVILGRVLGHEDYNDFWAACEKHNIAVAFHGGTNLHAPTAGTDRFTSRFAMHACSHPMEAQMAFVSLLESGVLERHPRLKFAFLEAGASWVPHWLWRLDNICYPEFPTLVEENIKMLPSEYFKRQCWVGIELGEPCLREVINVIGHDKLLYGSDFPHPDHLHFTTEDIAQQLSELDENELQAVLEQNAIDFYGFENHKDESVLSKETHNLAEVE
jgi:predicted TIM-barrel fold metal-dependent hydrolase